MIYSKKILQYNMRNARKYKTLLLTIAVLMFTLSITLKDNFEIQALHFSLVIIIAIGNILLRLIKNKDIAMNIYAYAITLWGIIRITSYSQRTLSHTPLFGIIMSMAFIHLFPKYRRLFYYLLTFLLISIALTLSIAQPFHLIATYAIFVIISFYINTNLYDAFIKEVRYKKAIKGYEEKLNAKVNCLQSDFNELYDAYPKILNFLSHSNLSRFNQENEFLISTFRLFSNLIVEADYGSLYTIENKTVEFIDATGHNLDLLTSMTFNHKNFEIDEENFKIIKDFKMAFQSSNNSPKEEYILRKATRPIKEALMFHVPVDEHKKVCIAMDIKKGSPLVFSEMSLVKIKAFRNIIKSYYQNNELKELKETLTTDIAMSLTNLLKIHDEYTTDHSEQVAALALHIGELMHLNENELQDLYYASLLHDIGKVIIPNTILNKKENLTEEEFACIKTHPLIGYEATKDLKNLSSISKYIKHHHEHYDGSGYPDQLIGTDIPLLSRIISVVDAYDAMISKRPYRQALTNIEAMEELIKFKNAQFDPVVVELFVELIRSKNKKKILNKTR